MMPGIPGMGAPAAAPTTGLPPQPGPAGGWGISPGSMVGGLQHTGPGPGPAGGWGVSPNAGPWGMQGMHSPPATPGPMPTPPMRSPAMGGAMANPMQQQNMLAQAMALRGQAR